MSRIYLSPPHLCGHERELVAEAFDSNWIAPLGPMVDAFERELAAAVEVGHAAAFGFGTSRFRIAPHQVRSEILRLLETVRGLAPRRLLEIGTARGGTPFLLARAAAPDAVLLSLDLPWSPRAGYAVDR